MPLILPEPDYPELSFDATPFCRAYDIVLLPKFQRWVSENLREPDVFYTSWLRTDFTERQQNYLHKQSSCGVKFNGRLVRDIYGNWYGKSPVMVFGSVDDAALFKLFWS